MEDKTKEIFEFAEGINKNQERGFFKQDSTPLAFAIALYAHRNQRRENGDYYMSHPSRCNKEYSNIFYYGDDRDFTNEVIRVMELYNLPYKGVREVILLHDVVEDTEFTLENIKEIFHKAGFGDLFDNYIEEPLRLVTHDKKESYDIYIDKLLKNETASLVKLLDLNDNLAVINRAKFDDEAFNKSVNYLKYFRRINDKYHFLERFVEAKKILFAYI